MTALGLGQFALLIALLNFSHAAHGCRTGRADLQLVPVAD